MKNKNGCLFENFTKQVCKETYLSFGLKFIKKGDFRNYEK